MVSRKQAWRIGVLIVGSTIVAAGIPLFVLPGPGTALVVAGLAILATEFAWAAWLLRRLKKTAQDAANSVLGSANESESIWVRVKRRLRSLRARPEPE